MRGSVVDSWEETSSAEGLGGERVRHPRGGSVEPFPLQLYLLCSLLSFMFTFLGFFGGRVDISVFKEVVFLFLF